MQEWIVKEISNITLTIVCISPWFLTPWCRRLHHLRAPSLCKDAALEHYNQRHRSVNRDFWWNYTPKAFSLKASKTLALFSEVILKIKSLNHCGNWDQCTYITWMNPKNIFKKETLKRAITFVCAIISSYQTWERTIILTYILPCSPRIHECVSQHIT